MDRWILSSLAFLVRRCNECLEKYNFQEATSLLHSFWLYDFCDVYLESLKPKFGAKNGPLTPSQQQSLDVLLFCVDTGLRLLAPFMPFLTEELWQRLPCFESEKYNRPESLCVASYPHGHEFLAFENEQVKEEVALMNKFIHTIRSSRSAYNLPNKIKTEGVVLNTDPILARVLEEDAEIVSALSCSNLAMINSKDEVPGGAAASIVSQNCTIFLILKVSYQIGHIQSTLKLLTLLL